MCIRLFLIAASLALAGPLYSGPLVHEVQVLNIDGQEREFYAHIPRNLQNMPLLVALHGMGGNAAKLRYGLGFNEKADQRGFAVLYPQGLRLPQGARHWNAGLALSDVDDVGFLDTLITHILRTEEIDPHRIYILGISNGGYMAYHMACHSKLEIAGIASVIGTISGSDWRDCAPKTDTELLHIHGELDPIVRFDGSRSWAIGTETSPPVHTLVQDWAERVLNHADATAHVGIAGIADRSRISVTAYQNQETTRRAALVSIGEFGHDWPFADTAGLDTAETITQFFFSNKWLKLAGHPQ